MLTALVIAWIVWAALSAVLLRRLRRGERDYSAAIASYRLQHRHGQELERKLRASVEENHRLTVIIDAQRLDLQTLKADKFTAETKLQRIRKAIEQPTIEELKRTHKGPGLRESA